MKKEVFALTTMLVFALCMSGVMAIDSWGMDSKIINGDKYVYNATVVIIDDPYHYYHYNRVVYENATVVTTTSNVIKVIVDGQVIPSPNGLPYRFSSADMHCTKPHYTNMPACVKKENENPVKPVIDHSKEYAKIGDVTNHFINLLGKSGNEKTFRDAPYVVQVGNMTFHLVKLFEPIREFVHSVSYKAVYEDEGGYYRVTIDSDYPFLGLKQSEKTINYINAGGIYYYKNFEFYQRFLTNNDGVNKTYINTKTFGGKYTLIDGTKINYHEYRGWIEYTVERTAAKPDFAKKD